MKRQVNLLLFPEVEVLDFAGPFEVFSVASELHGHALFEVTTVAAAPGPLAAVNGLKVLPDTTIDEALQADILIVPGGVGSRRARQDPALLDWLRRQGAGAAHVLSVCTGARLLAAAGLLAGQRYATHHEAADEIEAENPDATLVRGARYTDNGHVLTAAGVSSGIDLSLYLVGKLHGTAVVERTAAYIEYDWRQRAPG